MNPTEHLQLIKAECERLLAIAEKRWTRELISDVDFCAHTIADATYIAACAGRAVAGWRATIAAVDKLAFDQFGNAATIEIILAAWPIELLTNQPQ